MTIRLKPINPRRAWKQTRVAQLRFAEAKKTREKMVRMLDGLFTARSREPAN